MEKSGSKQIKKGKLLVSHRYDRLPLLPSDPGGVQQELVVQDLPATKVRYFFESNRLLGKDSTNKTIFVLNRKFKI